MMNKTDKLLNVCEFNFTYDQLKQAMKYLDGKFAQQLGHSKQSTV